MSNACEPYFAFRKYLQFNDLVIDNIDMLQQADLSGGFKTETVEYSFGHGSYAAFKARQQFSREQSLSMTIKIDLRKLRKEQRKFYKPWVWMNLSKPGKLWAIDGDQLLWANAFVKDFSEPYSVEKHTVSIDLEFVLYEGIWHKADTRKVFLQPYSACDFAECLDFREIDECLDCCVSCVTPTSKPCPKCACECEFLTAENSLCELKKEIAEQFYKQCGESYQIHYNCEAGNHIWGKDKMLGQKICKEDICKSIIAGQFYSDTVLDSENISITIIGAVKNPIITINGNAMQILGEYSGKLIITADGEIYHEPDECCPVLIVDINNLKILENSTFGFVVHQGLNSIIIETNSCCDMVCVYIKVDSITV